MSSSLAKKILLPVGILLVGVIVFVFLVKTRPSPSRRPAQTPRPLVQVYQVTDEPVSVTVRGFGTVRAKRKISLVPQVSGIVVDKAASFEPGGFFLAGEVLMRIDETDYRLAAEKTAADVARAEYNLALAEEEAEVARREWDQLQYSGMEESDSASQPNPLVLREPQLNLAKAELEAARAALTRTQVDLDRCVLKAVFDGRVLTANVDAGQYVRAGNSVGTIYATDMAEVAVPIPDADLAWIEIPQTSLASRGAVTGTMKDGTQDSTPTGNRSKHGSPVDIQAEFAGGWHHWPGRAVRLAGAVDDQSRQVSVVVEIQDPYRLQGNRPPLLEGMFVEALIAGRSLPGSVAIPRSALRTGDRVWVVDTEELLQIRDVSVARADIEEAIIAAGLRPGEWVCTSNLPYVTNGMQVKVIREPGPDESAGDAPKTTPGGEAE